MIVSMKFIQTRARMVASDLNLPNFKASRGWIKKYIRRHGIQSSIKLQGKGQAILPQNVAQRITKIQNIARDYELCNIYNQDESGLFYRFCQSRSYLRYKEYRAHDRGSYFQKAKQQLTVSFAVNSKGSHILPIRYIGSPREPTCFRLHPETRNFYSGQTNTWMDGNPFRRWVLWWYGEVKKVSTGPWLLILENCGGHDSGITLPGLRIDFLPPNTTAIHQPLDMEIISTTKIKYSHFLL